MGTLQDPLIPQPTPQLPTLKPGNESSEYRGKLIAQGIAVLLTLVNAALVSFDKKPLILGPEFTATAVIVLEALWMIWRQHNKNAEIRAQAQVSVADRNLEGLRLQAQILERTSQPKKS